MNRTEYMKQYRKEHPEKYRDGSAKYRQTKKGIETQIRYWTKQLENLEEPDQENQ